MLGKSSLTNGELQTISSEIEAVLNDRTITYCYDDEGAYPIPSLLLISLTDGA